MSFIETTAAGRAFFTKVLDAVGSLPDAGFKSVDADLRAQLAVGRPIDSAEDEVMTKFSAVFDIIASGACNVAPERRGLNKRLCHLFSLWRKYLA